jgi:hypothetical protein
MINSTNFDLLAAAPKAKFGGGDWFLGKIITLNITFLLNIPRSNSLLLVLFCEVIYNLQNMIEIT